MYVLNIHNMPKIFWGAWPLIIFERPKCSKVLVPLSKLSVSKNVWFTNARLGPLDFIHSEMLKRGMGGSGPSGKTATGVYYFRGWTPPRSNQGVYLSIPFLAMDKNHWWFPIGPEWLQWESCDWPWRRWHPPIGAQQSPKRSKRKIVTNETFQSDIADKKSQ